MTTPEELGVLDESLFSQLLMKQIIYLWLQTLPQLCTHTQEIIITGVAIIIDSTSHTHLHFEGREASEIPKIGLHSVFLLSSKRESEGYFV